MMWKGPRLEPFSFCSLKTCRARPTRDPPETHDGGGLRDPYWARREAQCGNWGGQR